MMNESFYSKILLFGEYSIIYNSMALTIPYSLFEGRLVFPNGESDRSKCLQSNQELKSLLSYIKSVSNDLNKIIDEQAFEFDLEQGLYFKSSIPEGYGLGSSGALCSAIFSRYKMTEKDFSIDELRSLFKVMESHFHGSSSGIDPLISYLGTPLLNTSEGIKKVNLPQFHHGEMAIFLLNTKRARRTEPLVNLFLEKCKNDDFRELIENDLASLTDSCVKHFLEGSFQELFTHFGKLSKFQFNHFSPMIPQIHQGIWEQGLKEQSFFLKLCGAGGGGFLLGMAKDMGQTRKLLADYDLRILWHL